jgi:hypothetical protein
MQGIGIFFTGSKLIAFAITIPTYYICLRAATAMRDKKLCGYSSLCTKG